MKVKVLNKILSKKNYLLFCLIYTSFRFLLNNNNERITQFVFFAVSLVYLLYRAVDNYRCFIKKEMIISYLIVVLGAISVLVNHMIDMVSIRALLMLVINFIAIIIDDSNDDNYINTFETVVYSILVLCSIHSILCVLFSITDTMKITNLGMIFNGRLKGFTYMSGTGEVALIGLGSNIYLFEKIKYKKTNKLFCINLLLSLINILVIILAQSRCSLYSMYFCLFIYIVMKYIKNNNDKCISKNMITIIIISAVLILSLYFILVQTKIFRLRPFSLISIERVRIWYAYLAAFLKENLLFGMGPSRFVYIYRNVLGNNSLQDYTNYFNNKEVASFVYNTDNYFTDLMPHSEYIRHLVIFGFVGFVCIMTFLILLIKKIIKLYKSNSDWGRLVSYLSVFYVAFPLISGLIENMLSFSNSPRYLESFVIFFIIGYIYKFYNEIIICKKYDTFFEK